MFEFQPDFEKVMKRFEAWWDCQILDRPLVSITFHKPPREWAQAPASNHASLRDRWLDTDFQVRSVTAQLANTVHYADALPVAMPKLGPEVFSAFYGCPLEFGERTSWSEPIMTDWSPESVEKLQIDLDGFYYKKIMEITDAYIEAAKNKFIVAYTDLHPGGDAIAAFRDPQNLCMDVLEYQEEIKALLDRITADFLKVYDRFNAKLSAAGMPSTTWLRATCKGKFHVPSCDFSCMISAAMFEDLFIPGIIRECRHMDRNMYHLDGPQALRYLDRLLEIPEIHAIQWVPGAGNDRWSSWIEVYQKIQSAGKAFVVEVPAVELNQFFTSLRPEGAWLCVTGIDNLSEAEAALKSITRWRK